MTQTTHPTPQQVRDWMEQRQREHAPPPTPDEIRRQLGWDLITPPQPDTDCAR